MMAHTLYVSIRSHMGSPRPTVSVCGAKYGVMQIFDANTIYGLCTCLGSLRNRKTSVQAAR
jgi:hypothetical protein